MKTMRNVVTLLICSCSALWGQVTVSKIFGEELPKKVLEGRIRGKYQGLEIKISEDAKLILQKPEGKPFTASIRRVNSEMFLFIKQNVKQVSYEILRVFVTEKGILFVEIDDQGMRVYLAKGKIVGGVREGWDKIPTLDAFIEAVPKLQGQSRFHISRVDKNLMTILTNDKEYGVVYRYRTPAFYMRSK